MSALDEGLSRLYLNLVNTGLPVFVGGSVAAMWYGEPRSTLDIDVVIRASREDAERIGSGFPPEAFYVPPLEVIRAELGLKRGGQFNVLDLASGLKADVYVAGDDPLIAYGFEGATPEQVEGVTLNIAPATYVVAMKLRFFSISKQDKHLRDIRSLLAISPESVDFEWVRTWAESFGVADTWEECQQRRGEE